MGRKLRASLSSMFIVAAIFGAPGVGYTQTPDPEVHGRGETHTLRPARLEMVMEVDMSEMFFANPAGEMNPVFRIPAGRTVGIHLHNEGDELHELLIGRNLQNGEYEQVLTKLFPSDLFFYYGRSRAEVEDAEFGEIEVGTGLRDVWIRMNVPEEFKGEWEMGCFVPDHYESGMHATLIIE